MSADLAAERGPILLSLARNAISRAIGLPSSPPPDEPWLREPGAAFVTLERGGELRGCIGSLEPRRPLGEDVADNARAAALRDPRFPPLAPEELGDLSIEISVLGPARPLAAASEEEAAARLGHDEGVILESGGRRATFLPQVWEDLPEPRDFLAQLKRKAGLPSRGWPADARLWTYSVTRFAEGHPRRTS